MSNREEFEKWFLDRQNNMADLDMYSANEAWQAATSTSNARYQTRIKELEGALKEICELNYKQRRYELAKVVTKALSTTTPDTAYQKALLEAEIKGRIDTEDESSWGRATRTVELRAQLASLNRNEPLGE